VRYAKSCAERSSGFTVCGAAPDICNVGSGQFRVPVLLASMHFVKRVYLIARGRIPSQILQSVVFSVIISMARFVSLWPRTDERF
jgi:hypothetical protein